MTARFLALYESRHMLSHRIVPAHGDQFGRKSPARTARRCARRPLVTTPSAPGSAVA
jgi:hypothetical protein